MSEPKENDVTIPNWLKAIGDARDSLVVLSAVIYILGYIVWSIYAWQNDLGLLPVLDSQYLIAGSYPFVLILVSIFIILKLDLSPSAIKKYSLYASFPFFLAVLIGLIFFRDTFDVYFLTMAGIIIPIIVFIGARILFLEIPNNFTRISGYVLNFFTVGVYFSLYVLYIFPRIPQSLGGPLPRCAYLEVVHGALSTEATNILIQTNENSTSGDIVHNSTGAVDRTVELKVLLASEASMLVSPVGSLEQPQDQQEVGILEIKQDLIKAIQWCD